MANGLRAKLKVCLVGDPQVGKSSLIRRFVHDDFDEAYVRTLGSKVSKRTVDIPLDDARIVHTDIQVWDVMGESQFREILKTSYLHGVSGVLGVCDGTRRLTLDAVRAWVDDAYEVAGNVPTFVLVNKADRAAEFRITPQELEEFGDATGAAVSYSSAKTGENVAEAFEQLAAAALQERFRTALPRAL